MLMQVKSYDQRETLKGSDDDADDGALMPLLRVFASQDEHLGALHPRL